MTSEMALRRLRAKIFDYSEDKEDQSARVLQYLKRRVARTQRRCLSVGPYSGLTRRELAQSRTCETDWF